MISIARKLVTAICLALLSACAGMPAVDPIPEPAADDAGHLIMTLAIDRQAAFKQVSWSVRSKTDGKQTSVAWEMYGFQFGARYDFATEEKWGQVQVLALPPGDYEIHGVTARGGSGLNTVTYASKRPFSIPVRIERGKSTYVGEYLVLTAPYRHFFQLYTPPRFVLITDQTERDLVYVNKKNPALREHPVVRTIPDVESFDDPFLRNKPARPADPPSRAPEA